ncbi:hypothetical protein ACMXYN_05300 [Neptuniibacter sp. PT8_73]|uniref:hypothetical protein n=1 Tax=Neptuniibacter sp. PT8_73 TaxID=3398206 RepID=UPI0039F64464
MEDDKNTFEIVIDFEKGGSPNRVFRSMADLIDSFQSLDSTLAEVIGLEIDNTLVLEDIDKGSLKTIIRNLIHDLPDEDLRNSDFKRIGGHFLVKAKYAVLKWCQEIPKLTSPEQVDALECELVKIAEESEINQIPAYTPPNRVKLLTNISSIQKSTKHLQENDSVTFKCPEGASKVTDAIEISDAIVEDVLTREVLDDRSTAILKVKKPDYLGTSKWVFKFKGCAIDVSITHQEWLDKFQNKEVSVLPGDSIRGIFVQYISYGHDNEVLGIRYELEHIDEVIEAMPCSQTGFERF